MNLFLVGLARIIDYAAWIYIWIIVIRCVLSFVQPNPFHPIVRFIYSVTDPLMDAMRKAFPFLVISGMDLSPIVLIFLVQFTNGQIQQLLYKLFTMFAGTSG